MEQSVIQIGTVAAFSGIFTIAVMIIAVAWKLSGRIGKIEGNIEGLGTRLGNLETGQSGTIASSSPSTLTEKGEKLLSSGGMKEYIDANLERLLGDCRSFNSLDTAYDVQRAALKLFATLELEEGLEKSMKTAAFEEGVSMDVMRQIGGIYLRDRCLDQLNMNAEDLDRSSPDT